MDITSLTPNKQVKLQYWRKRQTMRQRINERRFSAARFMALGWQFIRPGKQRVQL